MIKLLIKIKCRLFSEILSQCISNGEDFILIKEEETQAIKPDIIITDIYELNDRLADKFSFCKIALLDTGLKREELIHNLIRYKLRGIISFNTEFELFRKALKVIYQGQIWLSDTLIQELISRENYNRFGGIKITEKEKEIISLVCEGLSNKEISSKLFVSEQTVKAHLHRIFQKFNIKSRSSLVKIYSKNIQ
ncbi:response regulator transcription factor [Thermodesulfovibrio sp.]|uniref:helix-turn-helix transcriptional regulator n=1 Tax=Thermodesulfovibrio sp. TaxID=2067987 RepID=UPI0030B20DD9